MTDRQPKLVAHIVFRFDYGGLENGVVNIINGLSDEPLRHVVIALTEASDFAERLEDGVEVFSLHKRHGQDLGAYRRLYRLLRRLKPDIVHTRNIGTLDCQLVAFLARVPVRIHGEHGWDTHDPDGTNRKYRLLRRALFPLVHRVVTVSKHLRAWLIDTVGVATDKVVHICNGVDVEKFRPQDRRSGHRVVVGSVTRFSAIKDPMNLVEAFIALSSEGCDAELLMLGDGELYEAALNALTSAGLTERATLTGSRDDVAEQMRNMDVFVLGSLREGISNTILEAMASGLPIVASATGGNPELVEPGVNGLLVTPGDRDALKSAVCDYCQDADLRLRHGSASRDRVLSLFSLDGMVRQYRQLYLSALGTQAS